MTALAPHHAELLTASAIDVDVATEASVCSVTRPDELPDELSWVGRHREALPGLLFPWRSTDGREVVQYRPDTPVTLALGDTQKYLWPTGADLLVWVHPRMGRLSDDVSDLIVVEGTRQYLAAVSAAGPGQYVVGICGCHGWMADGVPLPDWAALPAGGHRVVVIFDADLSANRSVWNAADALGRHLEVLGASEVAYVRLAAGRKAGLDDYLAVVPVEQRHEVFARLVESAGKIGRAPARGHHDAERDEPTASEQRDRFDDVPEEAGWQLLGDITEVLERHVIFASEAQAHAVVLWIAHTWFIDALDLTPRLAILSPLKRCGKSRVLTLVRLLSRRGGRTTTVSASAAYLYRRIEESHPTLTIDEADTIFTRTGRGIELHAELRGILDGGYERGATAGRVVGEGTGQRAMDFDIFTPAALAGIGHFLPDSLLDRSVVVQLRRRRRGETVDKLRRRRALAVTEPLARRLAAWVDRSLDDLGAIEPAISDEIGDRAADAWEPLLAVAELAGGQWPQRARAACLVLNRARAELDDAAGIQLLRDLRDIFTELGRGRAFSVVLVEKLNALEESPWATWRQSTGFRTQDLAKMLGEFEVRPTKLRIGAETKRGYYLDDHIEDGRRISGLAEVFGRYLDDATADDADSHTQPTPSPRDGTNGTDGTPQVKGIESVPFGPPVPSSGPSCDAPSGPEGGTREGGGTDSGPLTRTVPSVPSVPSPEGGNGAVSERRDGQRRRLVFDAHTGEEIRE
jgi:hypothetical protein